MNVFDPNSGYKVGIKTEVVDALRTALLDIYKDYEIVRQIEVDLEYPITEQHFPRIVVSLQEEKLQLAGVGHFEVGTTDNGVLALLRHYRFEANLVFTVYALSAYERDLISSMLVNLIAFPRGSAAADTFQREIYDSEFIDMQIQNDVIQPGGESSEPVPWDDPTRRLYKDVYSIKSIGEFYTHENGLSLVTINHVKILPYREDQPVPTGSTDPRDTNQPWVPYFDPSALP